MWYEGLPGFRRKNMFLQAVETVRIGILFPFLSVAYIIAPHSVVGRTMRKPFIKFICHSASYFTFLCEYLCNTSIESYIFFLHACAAVNSTVNEEIADAHIVIDLLLLLLSTIKNLLPILFLVK